MKELNVIKDKNCRIDLNRVATIINNVSKTIKINVIETDFDFNIRLIEYPKSFQEILGEIGAVNDTIILTDVPYIDNFFFYEYEGLIILSFYNWQYFTTLPKENGLLYWVCVLVFYGIKNKAKINSHSDNTGCLCDFLGDKSGIDIGMKQASICNNCSKKVSKIKLTDDEQGLFDNIKTLLDILSKHSRWNESILEESITKKITKKSSTKRYPINKGEISVLIASPSDAIEEREILKSLDRQFRISGFEESTGYRIITKGWEDLAPRNGYAQDIINEIIGCISNCRR